MNASTPLSTKRPLRKSIKCLIAILLIGAIPVLFGPAAVHSSMSPEALLRLESNSPGDMLGFPCSAVSASPQTRCAPQISSALLSTPTLTATSTATPTATPSPLPRYWLRVTVYPAYTVGRVTQQPPPKTDGRYAAGTEVTLIAYPPAQTFVCKDTPYWSFIGWSGDVSGTYHVTSLVMTSDKNVHAGFREYFPPRCTPTPTRTSTPTPTATSSPWRVFLPVLVK